MIFVIIAMNEEMAQYDYLKVGNPKAIEKSIEMFHSNLMGHVSHDSLRNMKYLSLPQSL